MVYADARSRPACRAGLNAAARAVRFDVPPNWTRPRKFAGGEFGMPCLLVLKRLPEGSRHDKSELNAILRDHGVAA